MPTTEDVTLYVQAKRDAVLYADYSSIGSIDRARKYLTALRRLLVILPRRGQLGGASGENMEFDLNQLKALADEVQNWITQYNASRSSSGVTYQGFDYYRDEPW